jgi:hypothetical protein
MSRRYRDNLGIFARELDTDSSNSEAYFPNLFDSPIASDTLSLTSSHTMGDHEEDQPVKTLHDYLHPTRNSSPSCIMFPANQQNFDFKPGMIPLLPTFHGMDNDGDQGTTSKDLVQVPIGPVTRARAKKFKDVLNGLIQELWAQANSWRPIEHDPPGQQRIITLILVLEGSGQGQ